MFNPMKKAIGEISRVAKTPVSAQQQSGPNIKKDHTMKGFEFRFICDKCGLTCGPVTSVRPDFIGGGADKLKEHYMRCSECGKHVCKHNCWNTHSGKCLSCAPSWEIERAKIRPNVRSEKKMGMEKFYVNCSICSKDYGPGKDVYQVYKFVGQCPKCGKWLCKNCWNEEVGNCAVCSPLSEEAKKRHIKPDIRVNRNIKNMQYEYIYCCPTCAKIYGPKRSVTQQKDGGISLLYEYHQQCPDCGKHVCAFTCWNYKGGKCTLCSPLSRPEVVTQQKGMKNYYHIICTRCRKQSEPIDEVNWEKVSKVMSATAKIALAPILGVECAVNGAVGAATAYCKDTENRMHQSQIDDMARMDLANCPKCGAWVCIDCWDKTKGECEKCGGHC